MVYFLTFIFLMTVSLFIINNHGGPIVENKLDGQILSGQLMVYHFAASRACAVTCPAGPIARSDVLNNMRDIHKSQSIFTGSNFNSFSDGSYIFTFYNTPGSASYQSHKYAEVLSFIYGKTTPMTTMYSGRYSSSSSQLDVSARQYAIIKDNTNPQKYVGEYVYTAPLSVVASYAGVPIPDGVPMIATHISYYH